MRVAEFLLSMASRTTGVRVDEVTGMSERSAHNGIARLLKAGRVHKAVVAHRHVRYFAHVAMRDLFLAEIAAAASAPQWRSRPESPLRAPWSDDEPAVVPSSVVPIQCPGYKPRFQEHVLPFVHGGLRCA